MCPRATAQHSGAAMARATSVAAASAHSFGEEDYIDLDLSSCGEFEFRVRRSSAAAPCADELPCRRRLHRGVPRLGAKLLEADAAPATAAAGGRRSTATVAPLQHSLAAGLRSAQPARMHAEGGQRKMAGKAVHAKLVASRAFFRSLFARSSCSDEQCHGIGVRARSRATLGQIKISGGGGKAPFGQIKNSSSRAAPTTLRSSIEQEKLMDEEEQAANSRQRKSFSGVIKWRPMPAPAPVPSAKPRTLPSRRSSSGAPPPLKRSSSARSESEGLIQGAIAYCKRSQQQLVLARKSVSDAALCSFPGLA